MAAALLAYEQRYLQETTGKGLCLKPFTPRVADNGWLNLAQTWQQLTQFTEEMVLMELPGSLGTPLTPEVTVADIAWDWRLPVVLVAPVTAGLVGQLVAHVALARQARVHLKGIVINPVEAQPTSQSAIALIEGLTQIPVLGQLPHLPDPNDSAALAAAAAALDLERLFPLSMLLAS